MYEYIPITRLQKNKKKKTILEQNMGTKIT